MTKEQLRNSIDAKYPTHRAFVLAFNKKAGFAALDETTLSRQLSGKIGLSAFAQAAFILFFDFSDCT